MVKVPNTRRANPLCSSLAKSDSTKLGPEELKWKKEKKKKSTEYFVKL